MQRPAGWRTKGRTGWQSSEAYIKGELGSACRAFAISEPQTSWSASRSIAWRPAHVKRTPGVPSVASAFRVASR